MRKVKAFDELRTEYKREDLGVGVRVKYYEEYCKGTNLVLLSPDVAKVLPMLSWLLPRKPKMLI